MANSIIATPKAYQAILLYQGDKTTNYINLGNYQIDDFDIIFMYTRVNADTDNFLDAFFPKINRIVNNGVHLSPYTKFDHQDGTGAYFSSIYVWGGNHVLASAVGYSNPNWQLGITKVVGIIFNY